MNEIEQLRKENEELKQIIREGKEVFVYVIDFLGLKDAANDSRLMIKLSLMVGKLTRNPDVINKITKYIEKVNSLEI